MAKIQPISSWQNGEEKLGTEFELTIVYDNLSSLARFAYQIATEQVSHTETVIITPEIPAYDEIIDGETIHHDAIPAVTEDVTIIDESSQILVTGNLTIEGIDYQTWDNDPSANQWAYNWAAAQLNLVLIPNQTFA